MDILSTLITTLYIKNMWLYYTLTIRCVLLCFREVVSPKDRCLRLEECFNGVFTFWIFYGNSGKNPEQIIDE